MNTILVTGGAGYIGSHVCQALAAAGYLPVSLDNLSEGHRWAVQWGPLITADLHDRARLDAALREYRPRAVMHLAASAYVGESVGAPGKYYRNNVAGSLTLLEALRDAGGDVPLVFSSSCATYQPRTGPIAEHHPQVPVNPYGWSKLMVEQMLRDFGHAHGLRSISLRYFNAAGADPGGRIGEWHEPETHLIPLALQAAAGERPAFTVFGAAHATPDGTCVRDFIHVCDIAAAHLLALQALEQGAAAGAYNLGNGTGFSVREVLRTVRDVTGREVPSVDAPARPGDPPTLVGDAGLIRRELGWAPRVPDLADIVRSAWQWHQRKESVAP